MTATDIEGENTSYPSSPNPFGWIMAIQIQIAAKLI